MSIEERLVFAPSVTPSDIQKRLCKRTVAILDLLGFRQMVEGASTSELAMRYETLLQQLVHLNQARERGGMPALFPEHPPGNPWCSRFIFSDTVVLISDADDVASCLRLLLHVWRILQLSISANMPFRGAVAYGEMYVNPEAQVFLGRPLTDAYDLERAQKWVGVAIHPSIQDGLGDFFGDFDKRDTLDRVAQSHIFMRYPVPMAAGETRDLRVVNWRFNWIAKQGTRHHLGDPKDPDARLKIENTLIFAKHVRSLFPGVEPVIRPQNGLAYELRRWMASDTPGPLNLKEGHGDEF